MNQTNQSFADSFVDQINEELAALAKIEEQVESIDQTKGPLCSDALRHAIASGRLLISAKESVEAERGKKGQWRPWLEGRFGTRLPVSTAGLHMKLAEAEELLFDKMQEVSDKRMSLRQALKLIPLTEAGLKKRATAQAKAAKRKEEQEAAARQAVAADLSTEERIEGVEVDEFFTILAEKGDLEIDNIFMALKSTLDKDQLLDLATRLQSHLDALDEEEAAEEKAKEEASRAERQRRIEEVTRRV
jgi:hypothetical protein